MTGGGFGTYLIMGNEWARYEATKRSTELFAEHVMPAFQFANLDRRRITEQSARKTAAALHARQAQALDEAKAKYQAERASLSATAAD